MDDKKKKPFYKRCYFWVLVIILAPILIGILAAVLQPFFVSGDNPIGLILTLVGIGFIVYMFLHDKYSKKPNKKPMHKNWLAWLIAVFLIVVGWFGAMSSEESSTQSSQPTTHRTISKHAKKKASTNSQNMPGQHINPAKATKHEFYWTDKSNKHVRYFVSSKKITAIKYKYDVNWQNNTVDSQARIENILHDSHLRYGNDKQKEENTLLSNHKSYNLYSPAHKKWYWVRFDAGLKKDAVASFAIYPGKSSEAE